jgi:hypothetical protein
MTSEELKAIALDWLRAQQESDAERKKVLSNELSSVPYEDWQKARAIFPYSRKSPEDQNYLFRNVARHFQKEYINKVQLELTRRLIQAKRLNLVFAVLGAILGFATQNMLKHACGLPSWGPIEKARILFCEPKS